MLGSKWVPRITWYINPGKTGSNTLMRLISSFYPWSKTKTLSCFSYFSFPWHGKGLFSQQDSSQVQELLFSCADKRSGGKFRFQSVKRWQGYAQARRLLSIRIPLLMFLSRSKRKIQSRMTESDIKRELLIPKFHSSVLKAGYQLSSQKKSLTKGHRHSPNDLTNSKWHSYISNRAKHSSSLQLPPMESEFRKRKMPWNRATCSVSRTNSSKRSALWTHTIYHFSPFSRDGNCLKNVLLAR